MEWFKNLDKKIKIALIVLAGLILFTIAFCVVHNFTNKENKNTPEVKYNKNSEILKDREVNGLTIHDISLQVTDGQSNYRSKATNKTDKKIDFVGIEVTFYNSTEEIGKIQIYNERTIEPGETIDLVNYNDMDLLNATSVKIDMVGE